MKRVLVVVILMAAAFLGGYGPLYFENQRLQESARQTEEDLRSRLASTEEYLAVSNLHSELGLILIEVRQDNFGKARGLSSSFFDRLQRQAFAAEDPTLKNRLMKILERRDEITSDLASMDPEVRLKINKLYQDLFDVVQQKTPR